MTVRETGELIRIKREALGLTQAQLASAVGCSESAIAMYEAGRRRPKDEIEEALADVFNIPKWSLRYSENEIMPKIDDSELWQIREDFRRNPELRTIHSLTRNASNAQLRQLEGIIRALRGTDDE